MTVLTTLKISFYQEDSPSICLAHILEVCPPTLKTLSIYSMALIVESFRIVMKSIEHLSISSVTLDDELGEMLTYSFPNLVTLKLSYFHTEWVYIYIYIYIYIQTPLLQEAIIDFNELMDRDYEYGFSFEYPGITEVQHYHCTKGKKLLTSEEEIEGIPTIQIECCKVMKLVLDKVICIRASG
jgi:hypothetical protein